MQVASPPKQTLITHTDGLSGYSISEFCKAVLEKIAINLLYVQIVFYFYFPDNVGGATI